jgi:hypothetical protein
VTRIGVGKRKNRNSYVLVVHLPGSNRTIVKRRATPSIAIGDVVRVGRQELRVTRVEPRDERVADVYTTSNVIPIPLGEHSVVAEFIRYHALVRIFDGDPDAWLAHLEEHGGDEGDVRFARWIRSRLRQDPELLSSIREMVDATPFWRAAEA